MIEHGPWRPLLAALLLAATAAWSSPPALAAAPQKLLVDGRERSYLLHRPAGAPRTGMAALVVVLHGGFGSGARAQETYGWDGLADQEGFLVAYPDGIQRAWNAGGACCGRPQREDIDDVGFVSALLRVMIHEQGVDPTRIYLAGISNGAALALYYACRSAQPAVAAIGSVAGGLSAACEHPAPVSLLEIHGIDDQNIPMLGGIGSRDVSGVRWLPVPEAVDRFRASAACAAPLIEVRGDVTTRMSSCASGRSVGLITIAKAGHQWPGARSSGLIGRALGLDAPSTAMDATRTLWDFFRSHRLPAAVQQQRFRTVRDACAVRRADRPPLPHLRDLILCQAERRPRRERLRDRDQGVAEPAFPVQLLQHVERTGIEHLERASSGPPQLAHRGAHSQRVADIARERADIGAR